MKDKRIPYNPKLRPYAKQLRNNGTLSEILLWKRIKGRALGVEFHRQVPLLEYIVDFYCSELMLAIEIDGISHYYKYDYDSFRQNSLEKSGIIVVRFSDLSVKKEMENVIRTLEITISELQNNIPPTSLQRET